MNFPEGALFNWLKMIRFANGMIGMKNSGNVKADEVLERNKNLNRGFRKLAQLNALRCPSEFHRVNLEGSD